HQDGGSADDRRGRTMLLVRTRRMPRNHELKYLALYPRQSLVDPCVIRSLSDIFTVCSV
ncbi:hypothetical protein ALC60_05154, partial [Trachymyrmex zeteki]